MKKTVLVCDWCGKEEAVQSVGWRTLRYAGDLMLMTTDIEDKHFDSWQCIAAYAAERGREAEAS